MKNIPVTTFVERLLTAVHLNEINLRMALSAPLAQSNVNVSRAINSLLDFELLYGPRSFSSVEKADNEQYLEQSTLASQAVVLHLAMCQSELQGPLWDNILALPGLGRQEFEKAAYCYAHRHLQQRIHLDNNEVTVLVRITPDWTVCLDFQREAARYFVSKSIYPKKVAVLPLEKQLSQLQRFNAEVQSFVSTTANNEAYWPSLKTVAELELEEVNATLDKLFASLGDKEKKLLKKHSEEINKRVKTW